MAKPIFNQTGDDKDDYITVDGQIDWAIIPAYTIPKQKNDMPIRFRVGDQAFGRLHIYEGHGKWLNDMRRTAEELVWEKLSLYGGNFYKGNKKNRIALYVRLSPSCLLVLEPMRDANGVWFYSVVSLYRKEPKKGEDSIGVYSSEFSNKNANKALRKG